MMARGWDEAIYRPASRQARLGAAAALEWQGRGGRHEHQRAAGSECCEGGETAEILSKKQVVSDEFVLDSLLAGEMHCYYL